MTSYFGILLTFDDITLSKQTESMKNGYVPPPSPFCEDEEQKQKQSSSFERFEFFLKIRWLQNLNGWLRGRLAGRDLHQVPPKALQLRLDARTPLQKGKNRAKKFVCRKSPLLEPLLLLQSSTWQWRLLLSVWYVESGASIKSGATSSLPPPSVRAALNVTMD